MALGADMEAFGTDEVMADDEQVAEVYAKKGAKVADLTTDGREMARLAREDRVEGLRRPQDRCPRNCSSWPRRCTSPDAPRLRQWRKPSTPSRPRPWRLPRGCRRAVWFASLRASIADRAALHDRACPRRVRPDLQRRLSLLLPFLDRLAGRALGVPDRRRGVHVGGRVQARRGHVGIEASWRPAAVARTAYATLVDIASCASAAFSPGNPGPCSTRPGSRTTTPARPGGRRSGFRIR